MSGTFEEVGGLDIKKVEKQEMVYWMFKEYEYLR